MSIEDEIFNQYVVDKEKLIQYGFEQKENKLIDSIFILDGKFNIIIEYDGNIKGKVIEVECNDEYINYRLNTQGEFSSSIKNEFIKVLTDIREKCAEKQSFKYEQTKRINKFIYSKYHVNPEFLWDKFPNYCIYRAGKKWFVVLESIPRNKVDKNSRFEEEVEVINVKVQKSDIDNLLNKVGYYKAFHMNKQNWVSVILDETLSDLEIQNLINDSYEIVKEHKK